MRVKCSVLCGDAELKLSTLEGSCVQTIITSPPYWGKRDYGNRGELGGEGELGDYIDRLVKILNLAKQKLRSDGTLWLNIGDSYTSGNRKYRAVDRKWQNRAMETRPKTPGGLKPKDLIGIPWKVAFALQDSGWYLRQECIWYKPNAMPESVADRPNTSHEHFFLFSKSKKYYFRKSGLRGTDPYDFKRSVWVVNSQPSPVGYMACFPPSLIEPCVRASTRPNDLVLDPFCGSGTVGEVSLENGRRFQGIELDKIRAGKTRSKLQNIVKRKSDN